MENGGYAPILRPYTMLSNRSSKEPIAVASTSFSLYPNYLDEKSLQIISLPFYRTGFIHDLVGTKDRSTNLLMENGGYSPILRPYVMLSDRSLKETIMVA